MILDTVVSSAAQELMRGLMEAPRNLDSEVPFHAQQENKLRLADHR
jgi:hypothetical protein